MTTTRLFPVFGRYLSQSGREKAESALQIRNLIIIFGSYCQAYISTSSRLSSVCTGHLETLLMRTQYPTWVKKGHRCPPWPGDRGHQTSLVTANMWTETIWHSVLMHSPCQSELNGSVVSYDGALPVCSAVRTRTHRIPGRSCGERALKVWDALISAWRKLFLLHSENKKKRKANNKITKSESLTFLVSLALS